MAGGILAGAPPGLLPAGGVVVAELAGAGAELLVAVVAAVEVAATAGVVVAVGGETWGPATPVLAGLGEAEA